MSDATPDPNVLEILERAEKRAIAQVARDVELLGPLDEHEVKERVKRLPTGVRGPFVFALAALPSLRRAWAEQDRLSLGEAYAQMILRSMACFVGSEDFNEITGIGRVFGESEALLALVLEVEAG
ncbi:MAG: hypothetical protein VX726_06420 [Planctomycetota bacterium]|nr:hypothetical protein [Planctomycetota bacterium]